MLNEIQMGGRVYKATNDSNYRQSAEIIKVSPHRFIKLNQEETKEWHEKFEGLDLEAVRFSYIKWVEALPLPIKAPYKLAFFSWSSIYAKKLALKKKKEAAAAEFVDQN